MKILLTGATGFIGSNIAKGLLDQGHEVFATHRTSSSFEKCHNFTTKIKWINMNAGNWTEQVKAINPDQLIHSAWGGIEAKDRNNWNTQINNFQLSKEYFDLAKECCVKKVISLGSQAEYGKYSYPVKETTAPMPDDAYGAIKTLTANYLRNIFENSPTEWYWIRIFSVFGEHENSGWLIPSVISKLLKNESIPLTLCTQQYDYLYIDDFVHQLLAIVQSHENKSGIYNLCHSESITLKDLLIKIADLMGLSQKMLQFGAIPYRTGQNMLIAGDNSKFRKCFANNDNPQFGLTYGLLKTIEYHKKRLL